MPKPDVTTNPTVILAILDGLPEWANEHAEVLSLELGEDEDLAGDAVKVAEALRGAQEVFLREQKEDKGVYTSRNTLIGEIQDFDRGVQASVTRRVGKLPKDVQGRVLSDFNLGAVSAVRTVPSAQNRLNALSTAVEVHARAIDAVGRPRSLAWLEKISGFQQGLKANNLGLSREKIETTDALQVRDEARATAINLLSDAELAARAVLSEDGRPLSSLDVLFDTHNPPRGGGGGTPEPTPATPPAPTPAPNEPITE